jgi:hypothetical protein
MRRLARFASAAAALACAAAPVPARADFYTLEGRFQCLDRPGAVCFDATPMPRDPPPRESHESHEPAPPPPVPIAPPPAAEAKPPLDPVLAAAHRIEIAQPADGDVALLRRAAAAGDPRAIELLAWCALHGIGTARDPVAAYYLYGKAAAAAVPHASENQGLVFEGALTSAERERVLELKAVNDAQGAADVR